jgi:tRNA(Ile)-lysidine synthase
MLTANDRILLGVSGGIDSMVLFDIMTKLAKKGMFAELIVAHVDHMLRDEESECDKKLVVQTCIENNVKCFVHKVDVKKIAIDKKISIEMAARDARYSFFKKCCHENNLNTILTAHNADDQAETVLMRLIRGTTLTGISGINSCSDFNGIKLVRSLLEYTRNEIEEYAKKNNIVWREDSSNLTDDYLRNKIRHNIVPFITSEINSAFIKNITKMTKQFKIDDDFIEKQADAIKQDAIQGDCMDFSKIHNVEPALQNRVIRSWLGMHIPPERLDNRTINKIHKLHKSEKATCHLEIQNNCIIKKSYNIFSINIKDNKKNEQVSFELENYNKIVFGTQLLRIIISREEGIIFDNTDAIGKLPAKASLCIPQGAKVVVRNIRPGDRMEPLGLSGSKKLKDIFINAKVPVEKRQQIPIVEVNGIIAWIPGYRISKHFKIKNVAEKCTHISIEKQ